MNIPWNIMKLIGIVNSITKRCIVEMFLLQNPKSSSDPIGNPLVISLKIIKDDTFIVNIITNLSAKG